ncbi:MAG: preprotein translocase subunit SecG [Rickettsiaceae bacterium]
MLTDILLIIHVVVAILLIIAILLQKSGTDGISALSGAGSPGVITKQSAAKMLVRTTIVLAAIFFANSIILANISGKQNQSIAKKIETEIQQDLDIE